MPITTSWKQITWKPIIAVVAIGVAGWLVLTGLDLWANKAWFEDATIDRTSDWDAYYQDMLSEHFIIPDEAKIVSATETLVSREVKFRLPESKSPEDWLAEIADASGLAEYRQHRYAYDAGWLGSKNIRLEKKADTYLLEYSTGTGEYRAIWGWD